MKRAFWFCLLAVLLPAGAARAASTLEFATPAGSREAVVCRPGGAGPFPVVVFNHPSIVDGRGVRGAAERGYDLAGFCEAFAKEGYLAFFPIRERTHPPEGYGIYKEAYTAIVSAAVDRVKTLAGADPRRIALMGFSLGGLVAAFVAPGRADLRALVLFAPSFGFGSGSMEQAAQEVPRLAAPVLLLVDQNDFRSIRRSVDLLERSLGAYGKEVRVIRYLIGAGHYTFYTVGPYWSDVTAFLQEKMR